MAEVLDASPSTAVRHWQANGLKPHLVSAGKHLAIGGPNRFR